MQDTRQYILEILRDVGQATVDEIVGELCNRRGEITAVTVRHHLKHLQKENLITSPQLLHRSTPGRPQHVYTLTEKASDLLPNNYQRLASGLLAQLQSQLSSDGVNVILQGVADDMATEADIQALSMDDRLDQVVNYLNNHGYDAEWQKSKEGYILYTHNCPYHHLAMKTDALCAMDMRLISSLLGVVPRLMARVADGDASCAYIIPTGSG